MSGIFHSLKKASPKPQIELDFLIRFFDYDGTLLKEQWVEYGGASATAPELPTHDNLTFHAWNKDYTKTNKNMDVGAVYRSEDTFIYATISPASGMTFTFRVYKSAATNMTVYWGDGTSSSNSSNYGISFTKNYKDYGNYIIRIESEDNYHLGQGAIGTPFYDGSVSCITKLIMSDKAFLRNYSFYREISLKSISIGRFNTIIPMNCFDGCAQLNHVTIPDSVLTLSGSCFTGNTSLRSVSIAENVTSVGLNCFYYTQSLENIIFPWKIYIIQTSILNLSMLKKFEYQGQVTQINSEAFSSTNSLKSLYFNSYLTQIASQAFSNMLAIEEFIFDSTTPPTISSDSFNLITRRQGNVKIYVPDASVASYKSATNWNTLANYIYPRSSRL